ncbi:Ppx/GppA phosphatase [Malonomonas rubra DSM 5091]|uniref:Ppx/GppA phosphatase n=1 Tax=Malonomonas rubra DSM 5091 TaxID=1122189 RepID=A0A1M6GIQ5_MALRU|nr:Ppx/GppA phosphatase family protein [Malonomonas rubra]SHJ09802.1 Ppx/GppA phosphatase [Malonomonas rubra DSM 5091]
MKESVSRIPLTIAAPPRLAAIDIGTNSFRCIVVEVDPQEGFRILDDEKAQVRLGEGLNNSGIISPEAQQRAIEALQRMCKIISGLGAQMVEVVATSAVRKANNRDQFIRAVKDATGLEIKVIDGDVEADLATLSVHHNFAMEKQRFAVADIGGGSVEIVIASGRHTETVTSLELGAVFLTEKFIHSNPPSEEELKQLRKYIRKSLKQAGIGDGLPVSCLVGSGGTMTNIGSMVMAMRGEDYESVHRYEVLHSEVVHLLAMLTRKNQKERQSITGLSPERADIIIAGMVLTDELMRRSKTNLLRINAKGIREGLILQSLQKRGLLPVTRQPRDWRKSVIDFARSCRFDEQHSEQVCRLACQIFDTIAPLSGLGKRERELLEAAALLHDIGYFISYHQHHKHSYHLIRHANLFGFTPREREIIANLARYHRKAKPKKSHSNFCVLSEEDRLLVRQLGAVLRLADGLDRRRNRQISDLDCQLDKTSLSLTLSGNSDLSVEAYGAETKGDLFSDVFGYRIKVKTVTVQ